MNSKALLQLPPGSAGLFLEEAAAHQEAIDATNRLFARWGYTMVHTPMVDFFDAHSHMIGEDEQHRLYRLIGRDGEVLMLRADITVFLLKHFQSLLKGADFPLRLSYSDSILRHEESIDISRNEHYQAGAELIGAEGRDGDGEILLLLCENLETLGIGRSAIHIGIRGILDACFPKLAGDTGSQEGAALLAAVADRQHDELYALMSSASDGRPESLYSPAADPQEIVSLFSAIADAGSPEELAGIGDCGLAEIRRELNYLEDLAGLVRSYFPRQEIRIDPSEVGRRHYYSGLAFQVYLPELPNAVASGGRYDRLIAEMGMENGAVGYQVMLSALQGPAAKAGGGVAQRLPKALANARLEDRYETARRLRREGKNICL